MAREVHAAPPEQYCEAWQANPTIIPEDLTLPSDDQPYFFIIVSAVFETYGMEEDEDVDELSIDDMLKEQIEHEECFLEPCSNLVQEQTSWSKISHMLSQVHVPIHLQPTMIPRICHSARIIAPDPINLGCKIIPMMVQIVVDNFVDWEDGTEGGDGEIARPKPARKESIESLESIEIEQSTRLCVICQAEMVVGSTARRMPCRHVYHSDCIFNWLGVGNFCPLCRFELPS